MPLADAPGTAARLAQGMQRIAGLIEIQCRKGQQVEARLHQLRMTDHDFDASLQLPLIPLLALIRGNRRAQNGDTESGLPQDYIQPKRDILHARIGCVHLAAPALPELLTNVGDEGAFLCV